MTENAELNPRTFDLFAMAQGDARTYPQDILDVYLDHGAAHQAHVLELRIARETDTEKVNALDAERNALLEKVKASRLTFHLKGLSAKAIKAVEDQADAKFGMDDTKDGRPHTEKNIWRNFSWLASHIADVYNANDERDSRVWDFESVSQLANVLPGEEFDRLMNAMQELTFRARYFEQVQVNPDFS